MKIEQLINFLSPVKVLGTTAGVVDRLMDDSRLVTSGDAFIAVRGTDTDGHQFITSAINNGATVIIAETEPESEQETKITNSITWLVCPETRSILGPLALKFVGNPQNKLKLIGVTGTNGKTTVTTLVWQVLSSIGYQVALLGTVTKWIGSKEYSSNLTTPGSIELANDMKLAVESGCTHFIMEVSSHALEQGRTNGLNFDTAVFTNLTHDHLDYHRDFNHYAAAKKIMFDQLTEDSTAIINMDDSYGKVMVTDCKATIWDLTLKNEEYYIHTMDQKGLLIDMDGIFIESPLTGEFNAYNVAQAYLSVVASGIPPRDAAQHFKDAKGAIGRLERISLPSQNNLPAVFVDYAHTPNALENVLITLNGIRHDNEPIITVFGCGGDRDRTKRPIMAAITEKLSTHCIVTSDNPRYEDPSEIIDEVCTGFTPGYQFERESDRETAIKLAISTASANAMILVAGKGHEPYQEIKGVRHQLDDREICLDALKMRVKTQSVKEDA
jgi:UDP-N-acetylmuramoyl-L-alanyl-D-glutamate--2,6-diaminopimelate ligase